MSILSPYRVLDLTTERGLLCGQMLADLGADVVKVEPPGGSSARRIGPFYKDAPHPDRSLYWWAYNRNKRAITLDLERDAGRDLLRSLVERADFLPQPGGAGEPRHPAAVLAGELRHQVLGARRARHDPGGARIPMEDVVLGQVVVQGGELHALEQIVEAVRSIV